MSRFNTTHLPGQAPVLSLVETHLQEITPTREENACLQPTVNHDKEIVNLIMGNSSSIKQGKLRSKVWKEFSKFKGKDGQVWAKCKHCTKKFDGSSKKGTTHLNNHLKRCRSSKNSEENGDELADHYQENGNTNFKNPVVLERKLVINQELKHLDVVRAIIKYGLLKLNFIKPDILLVYKEEKAKLFKYLTALSCRFSLAIKWVDECLYIVLHFIDDDWELKQKTISFHPALNDFSITFQAVLSEWNINKTICSLVTNVDNENFDYPLKSWVTEQGSFPFSGPLLSARCLSVFLKSYNWGETKWATAKISKCLDYVHKPSNKQKFQMAIENAQSMGKKVISQSVPTYCYGLEGLEIAVGFKEAFLELEDMDYDFKLINLAKEEWDKATAVCEFLKMLNDAARSFCETKYTTANVYFPKVCELHLNLLLWQRADKYIVHEIASRAKEIFVDKYWNKYKLVLAIAIVLDPRFKLDIVERWYIEIYGIFAHAHLKETVDVLTNVYNEYAKGHSKMLDEMGRPFTSSQNSELLIYLKEPKIPPVEEFDILAWWHLNSSMVPIIARMARDFLAIPISPTAFAGSILSTEFDNITSCYDLDDDIKPALVCTKSWLENEV